MNPRSDGIALALGILSLVLVVATLVMGFAARASSTVDGPELSDDVFSAPILGLVYAGVGSLIAYRRRGNLVGWTLLIAGLAFCSGPFTRILAFLMLDVGTGEGPFLVRAALVVAMGHWTVMLTALLFLLVLFPTGEFPSRRWRTIAFSTAAGFAVVYFVVVTAAESLDGPFDAATNPLYVSAVERVTAALGILIAALHLVLPAAGYSLIQRFRRSRGAERAQFKWFAFAAALFAVGLMVTGFLPDQGAVVGGVVFGIGLLGMPVTIAVAVFHYRLYDIDRIINRTLVYGSLTAATVGAYVLLVFILSWAARALTGEQGNEVVVAATTLIVAALFQPARRRIQRLVDRRFYRSRYDAARTLEAFQSRLRDEVDLPTLQSDLARVVTTTLQPEAVGVWLLQSSRH